nr:TonB-dependent receptor [Muribaculaceae bacterium]
MNRKFLTESLPIFILPYCILASTAGSASGHSLGNGLESDTDSLRQPTKAGIVLKDVVVEGNGYSKDMQMRSALSTTYVGKQFIETNFSGSLMQSLEKIPGVKAMSVGSNESKPTIRGLGFNRVVVAENGIKHEGQQWGDDHGLEIDQYDIDHAEVIKGPASLSYGSDAIGGVINLTSTAVPQDRFKWSANLFARSVNDAIGTSVRLTGRKNNFWYKANATFIDYADQRVPVDSIQYYSYYIKLHNRRLRNTSGRETDGSLTIGHTGNKWSSWLRISDVNTKSGFFANAHGLEVRLSEIDYDRSARDVDLPQHSVNHLFVSNHTEWHWKGGLAESNISWQNNHQRELSEPVSHGYMPKPDGTLEHSFDKNTVSAAVNVKQTIGTNSLKGGVNAEYQHNRSGGWSFVLPDFELLQFGIFLSDHFAVIDNIILSTGIRFDYGSINTHSYHDWFKTPTASGDSIYAERSANLHRAFNSVTWSAGIDNHIGNLVLKVNIGKSFRMPIAKELGIDGVNYSIFRYEKGNANLNPEESYQLDAAAVYS